MHQPKSGEIVSFEEQFRQHYLLLCTVAYYIVEDNDAARDIVQDFFLYCWNKRNDISINYGFKSYAVRAVKNASLTYIQKSGKVKLDEMKVIERLSEYFPETEDDEEDLRHDALWAAVSRLPEQRRKIFLLSSQDGLRYKDIAGQLGISINTVKTQIKLALQYLRKECGWMIRLIAPLISLLYA
ncbi:RNA polymerase sigma-70 factor [Chitinophaga deserti]|uniref:RNA polymerase sigma-70 factor n=1 Tax=Chitinophaga deserti TaxID=2164099 RepID=UPI0013002E44|nr:RNA polymerase sigma-70 factor [Chitinophaga deserti]